MKKPSYLVWALIGLTLATCAKVILNTFHDSEDDPSEVFSDSASEARRAGILISDLMAKVAPGTKDGRALIVSEAWIEKCAVHRYSYIWFHRRVPAGGATIVIKLKEPVDPRFALWPPDRKASFGWIGGYYFVRHFKSEPEFPMTLDGGTERDLAPMMTLRKPNQPPEPTSGLRPAVAHL
jgi:hypothetical protein